MALRFDENRKLAWVVLAACVLLSLLALGGGALVRERSKVLKVFDEGTDTTLPVRYSMDAYLDSASEYAQVMASEAEIHMGQSQLTDAANAEAADLAKDALGLDARFDAFISLTAHVEKLYSNMKINVSDADFRDFKLAYDNFIGQVDMLNRDEYHALAKSYNALIAGFPGGVIARILGQGALNTFGG